MTALPSPLDKVFFFTSFLQILITLIDYTLPDCFEWNSISGELAGIFLHNNIYNNIRLGAQWQSMRQVLRKTRGLIACEPNPQMRLDSQVMGLTPRQGIRICLFPRGVMVACQSQWPYYTGGSHGFSQGFSILRSFLHAAQSVLKSLHNWCKIFAMYFAGVKCFFCPWRAGHDLESRRRTL